MLVAISRTMPRAPAISLIVSIVWPPPGWEEIPPLCFVTFEVDEALEAEESWRFLLMRGCAAHGESLCKRVARVRRQFAIGAIALFSGPAGHHAGHRVHYG